MTILLSVKIYILLLCLHVRKWIVLLYLLVAFKDIYSYALYGRVSIFLHLTTLISVIIIIFYFIFSSQVTIIFVLHIPTILYLEAINNCNCKINIYIQIKTTLIFISKFIISKFIICQIHKIQIQIEIPN